MSKFENLNHFTGNKHQANFQCWAKSHTCGIPFDQGNPAQTGFEV